MNSHRYRAGPALLRRTRSVALSLAVPLVVGCAGDARVELAAADSIESLAAAFDVAFSEYHAETESADDARESAVIAAFVQRVAAAGDDPAEQERHSGDFTAALGIVRADRRVEWSRYTDSRDNLDTLREVTSGLRRLALESLTLSDEARRYLHSLVEAARRASAANQTQSAVPAGKEVAHVRGNR